MHRGPTRASGPRAGPCPGGAPRVGAELRVRGARSRVLAASPLAREGWVQEAGSGFQALRCRAHQPERASADSPAGPASGPGQHGASLRGGAHCPPCGRHSGPGWRPSGTARAELPAGDTPSGDLWGRSSLAQAGLLRQERGLGANAWRSFLPF